MAKNAKKTPKNAKIEVEKPQSAPKKDSDDVTEH
jgi:hypothetical protein